MIRQGPFREGWRLRGKQAGIVAAAVLIVAVASVGTRSLASESGVTVIPGVDSITRERVDRVTIRDAQGAVSLVKVNSDWHVGTPAYYHAAEGFLVDRLWEAAERIDRAQLVARTEGSHVRTGVTDDGGKRVEFWGGEDLRGRFIIADDQSVWTDGSRLCYLRREGDNEVYGVFCARPGIFGSDVKPWYDLGALAVPREEIESLKYSYPNEEFEVRRDGTEWLMSSGGSTFRLSSRPCGL